MTDVRSVAVRLSAEVAGYVRGMREAGAETRKALGEATKHAADHSKSLDQLGGTAGKVGLAAAAGLGAIVGATARFDKQMSAVKATGQDAAGSFDELREAAVEAGADTAFSATEAAAGIENLAKAGVDAQDVLSGGLSGALDLAAAGEMGVAEAAEAAAGAMAQFKLEGEDVPHIADLLAAGAGKAQGEVSDMVMALKQAGTVSAQTGLSLEETVGSLAAMAEQSLLGSDAGTSFKTMLAALTPNSEKAAAAMEQYNIHAFDAQGNFVGMTELAGQLRAGLGDLTDEQRAMALETIFGSDAVRAASIIFDNGAEGIAKWTAQVNDAGFAAEVAGTKMDNLAGDWEELTGSLETALIGSGEGSTGMLREAVQAVTDLINVYNELSPETQSVVTGLLAITAVTGGGLWFGTKVIRGVSSTRQALSDLGVDAGKTKGALTGVAKAGAALGVIAIGHEVLDSWDDAALSATQLEVALNGLAEGRVHEMMNDLSFSADNLGEALKQAAWNDIHILDAADEVEALDVALGGLAATDLSKAEDAFATIVENGKAAGLSVEEITDLFPEYSAQLELAAQNAEDVGTGSEAAADGMSEVGAAAEDGAEAVDHFAESLEWFNAQLDQRGDLRSYRQSLRDFADAAKEAPEKLRRGTEAWDEMEGKLDDIAGAALSVAEDLDEVSRRRFLDKARDEFIAAAREMDIPKAAARALADELGLLDKKDPRINVTVDDNNAASTLRNIRDAALEAAGTYDITFQYLTTGQAPANYNTGVRIAKASGGAVFGPGTETSDSIHALLSNDEHVWSAAEVRGAGGHGSVEQLRRLARSGQLTVIGGYAEGGQIHANPFTPVPRFTPVSVGSASGGRGEAVDYDRLAAALASARPLYGQMTVQPHNYSEFRRQMEADQQTAGLGGRNFE